MKSFSPTNLRRAAFVVAAVFFVNLAQSAPIPFGSSQIEVGSSTNAITVYTYKPKTYHDGPVLFVFHGVLRNAADYRDAAIPIADRFNVLVAAPLFDTNRFPGDSYMRGGVIKKGVFQPRTNWTYNLVPELVNELRRLEDKPKLPYYFIGHSGGAQFLMRLAAFSPLEARRIVAANPGSDLFPRRDWKFGYGFGGLPAEFSDDEELQRYLAAPFTLYLGQADIDPQHPELDRSAAAEREGAFRLERGRNCFAYAQNLARERGWKFNWRKVETPGIAHDSRLMFSAKEVAEALFGPEKSVAISKP